MTCIVGLVSGGTVYIGGDSAGVSQQSICVRADRKVFTHSDMVFGFTSSFRMGQILRFGFTPPPRHPSKDAYEYMVTEFIDAVRNRFTQAGFMRKFNEQDSGGCFLVGYDGKLFMIDSDFQVAEPTSAFYAVGSGANVALGAMYAQDPDCSPDMRIRKALEAAAYFTTSVRAPFLIQYAKRLV